MVLSCGGLENLSQLVYNSDNPNIVKNGTWAISNLCRGIYIQIREAFADFSVYLSRGSYTCKSNDKL
jgi:hypothetical protein